MGVNYIVSGYMRTGTSMMMKALDAGGMETAWDKGRINPRANRGGVYELDENEIYSPGFPTQYEGKVIKLLSTKVRILKPGKYLIVFMRRNQEEVLTSYSKVFNEKPPLIEKSVDEDADDTIAWLSNKGGIHLTVLDYHDVLKAPLATFTALAGAGWPINAMKAAKVVDPTQHRVRAV